MGHDDFGAQLHEHFEDRAADAGAQRFKMTARDCREWLVDLIVRDGRDNPGEGIYVERKGDYGFVVTYGDSEFEIRNIQKLA